ncbi:MAG: M1 family metallopeptidase [Lentimicrobiaceae bacterium]|nr:M1 family metallopeptidase [Lentimicrobiaceae bacterium]MBT3455280.1 M1 family metallopeptidase [Lentimicrobiaceae bacterium]MBT4062306.1 M1 family metallopeptidase [Lentimicrobiaceae bacterium]MBT5668524.1 M1 family metallopeptidase [Lentimicrobiaceae bacterium]MBT5732908.1 M1 family metallopeptidase [Lentimicrobiaceae bacterium]
MIFIVVGSINLIGQTSTKMSLENAIAFQNGTRSNDGKPGPNYWQNHADYKIDVELLIDKSMLSATETVIYHNNSPDTLNKLVLRLYPDIYKKGNARSWPVAPDDLNDGTIIKELAINGNNININDSRDVRRSATNLFINLEELLLPSDSLKVDMSWELFIPKTQTIRMGNYGNNRLFLAYWYPQIAVYDDIDGWDILEYFGTVEFYNDFNNYEVNITSPPGFTIWATGDLMNMNDIYTEKVIKNHKKASTSSGIINIFTVEDCRDNRVLKNTGKNIWSFVANDVPDFSFATSLESNWDAASTIADKKTNRRVLVDAVYPDSSNTFDKAVYYGLISVNFMVDSLPGYPFPYSHITSFCNGENGGGMESPMMVNEGDPSDDGSAMSLIFHEILHTYFPFYMGINERKYAWMDEGWASWLSYGIADNLAPDYNYFSRVSSSFENMSGKEKEVPLMFLSYQIKDYQSYRSHSYTKPALAYAYLRNAIGDSIFKSALYSFIDRWHNKHPGPYDFFNTFENISGQDLDWFFIPWFFSRAYADIGIKKVTFDNKVVVENNGGLPLPIYLSCTYLDDTQETFYRNASVWKNGDRGIIFQLNKNKKPIRITVGNDIVPDVIKENNEIMIE